MATAKSVLEAITIAISNQLGENAEVAIEFTGRKMELPISKIMVATGIRNAAVSYQEGLEGVSQIKRNLTVEALICAPKSSKGVTLADTVDGILSAVLGSGELTLVKFYTGKAS